MAYKLGVFLREFYRALKKVIYGYFTAGAGEYVKMELHELRNAMGVLLFSPLVGFPLFPAGVALELLPFAEDALKAALGRSFELDDPMGLVGGRFDIE